MDRKTFVRQLEALLADWPDPQEREEQILYYEEMLVDLTDEQASQRIEQLGGPQRVAEELRRKKGLPPQPAADAGWQQAGWDWGSAGGSQPPLEQRLAETKRKNRRRSRHILAAAVAGVVVLAAAAGVAVWMLSRQQQPGAESGSGSMASSVVPSSGSSAALSGSTAPDGSSAPSSGAASGSSPASSSEPVLPVSGQLPEEAEQATQLTVNATGADLTVKSGEEWKLTTSENASVQSSVTEDTLDLQLANGAFVLTVPAGVTDIQITASQGRLDLLQLEADSIQLDSITADTAVENVSAASLSVDLQMGNLQASGLSLTEELDLELRNGSAQITMEQPASYGYTVDCSQGSLVLGQESWTSESQPQQAQQTGEGFQFDIEVTQGSGSILFAAP